MVLIAIVAATIVSFAVSALLYAMPPVSTVVTASSTPRPGLSTAVQMGSVVGRSLVASCLVAGLMAAGGWDGAASGALLGLALASIPAALLSGAVVHENSPIPVASVHLLDWALKLVVIGTVVGQLT